LIEAIIASVILLRRSLLWQTITVRTTITIQQPETTSRTIQGITLRTIPRTILRIILRITPRIVLRTRPETMNATLHRTHLKEILPETVKDS